MSGNAADAERFYAQSIASFQAMGRPEHAIANTIRNNWGMASAAAGDVQGALAQYDEALSVARKHAAGGDVPAYLLANRAMQLDNAGRYDEALRDYGSAIEIAQRAGSINTVVAAQLGSARVLLSRGDLEGGARAVQGTAALFDQGVPRDGPPGMNAQLLQARITALRGDPAAAEQQYNRIAQFWEGRQMGSAGPMAIVLRWRAEAQLQRGNTQAALDDALRALDIGLKLRGGKPYSSLTGLAQLLLSRVYAARGQLAQADAAAREADDQLSHALGLQSPDTQAAKALVAASASRTAEKPAP
jgi:tetratricopeptide (TPR) repeat protein